MVVIDKINLYKPYKVNLNPLKPESVAFLDWIFFLVLDVDF